MSAHKAISRKLKVERWILGTIMVLGIISGIFLMIVSPTPARLKIWLGMLCILVSSWADGSYRWLQGFTISQIYRGFRAGRRPPLILAAWLLWSLGVGLLFWAWLG